MDISGLCIPNIFPMLDKIIDKDLIALLKSGAKKMHKHKKRTFQAEVANEYFR